MGFKRTMVSDGGLSRPGRAGDGMLSHVAISTVTADAAATISAAQIASGAVLYTGFSAGRVLTTDTAVNLAAAFPEMDIGDIIQVKVSIVPAFAGTFAAGAGVTLAGRTTCPASSSVDVYIVRTGAATFTWTVL